MMVHIIIMQFFIINSVLPMDKVTRELLTPIVGLGEYCGYMSCRKEAENSLNVHIVPATHVEMGLTTTFDEHFTGHDEFYSPTTINMKNILDAVITSLWTSNHRKFTISDIPYFFHWWKHRDATVHRMVYELLRQGRLYIAGGGWGMSDEGTTSYHAIIDHFTYSLRKINSTFLECGRPLVTWQADVYGHSREFASLMAQMGFDGHFIHPISFEDELARMKVKNLEFIWRGSDDLGSASDIFTHKLYDGFSSPPGFCFGSFCEDPLIVTSDATFGNAEERAKQFFKIARERQSPYYTTNHIMMVMGSRSAYSDAEMWFANIDKLIEQVNRRANENYENLVLFYSSPMCYLQAVNKNQPKLTTKQDDFFPYSVDKNTHTAGMYTSRPAVKLLARRIHLFSQIAKQLQVIGELGNNDRKYEEIMWIAGAMQDHVVITGASRARVILDYARKVETAITLCMQMYRTALNKLRKSPKQIIYYNCPFNVSSCWNIEAESFFIVVYNPLGWPVTMPVRLPAFRRVYQVWDPNGKEVDHSIVSIQDIVKPLTERGDVDTTDEIVFLAKDLPPMGYKSYYITQVKHEEKRFKRDIIKLNNKKKTKFFTRPNNMNMEDESILDDMPEYEYLNDNESLTTTTTETTKILFGNVTKVKETNANDNNVVTPPPAKIHSEVVQNFVPADNYSSKHKVNTSVGSRETTPKRTTPITPLTEHSNTINSNNTNTLTTSTILTRTDSKKLFNLTEISNTQTDASKSLNNNTQRNPTNRSRAGIKKSNSTIKVTDEDDYDYYDETTAKSNSDEAYRRLMDIGYFSAETGENVIQNEYIKIYLDPQSKSNIAQIDLSNGVQMTINIQMCYYVSDDPVLLDEERQQPGPHIFRPVDAAPVPIANNVKTQVLKTKTVEEVHFKFAHWAAISIRLYKTLPTIEVDWTVGPIPIDDTYSKDVFIRYSTDLANKGVFYTDSNGRQMMKRIRNLRPTYMMLTEDYIAGNFYPVTSKVFIEDITKNLRFSIFPDRSVGVTSLQDGSIDIMVHRRILMKDRETEINLNDTEYGQGQIIRGTHYLYLSKADYKPNKIFEKKFAKELELKPQVLTSNHPDYFVYNYTTWSNCSNEYTALRKRLPVGIHVLTLEKWIDKYLLRLENYLEKSDVIRKPVKTVFIKDLFRRFTIVDAKEMTLGANLFVEDYFPLPWNKGKFIKNFNEAYGESNVTFSDDMPWQPNYGKIDLDKGIQLYPQQIRTFVVTYTKIK